MKKTILIFVIFCIAATANAQTYKGTIKNSKNEAVPFANAVLYTLPDSTFITGSVTNDLGEFVIESSKPIDKGYIIISCIGYESKTVTAKANTGVITLNEDVNQLGEVVVKSKRPVIKMISGGLETKVDKTILSELGTANDVLAQIPMVTNNSEGIKVLGKGTPEIYINNRLVRDYNELTQLEAKTIKNVQVITNPSSKYKSNVTSVIKITTLKKQGDGFSGSLYGYTAFNEVATQYVSTKFNYRKNKFDVFGGVSLDNDGWEQKRELLYKIGEANNGSFETTNGKFHSRSLKTKTFIGSNYYFDKHSIGIRYDWHRQPNGRFTRDNHTDWKLLSNGTKTNFDISALMPNSNYKNHINAYYDGKLSKNLNTSVNIDYVQGETKKDLSTLESYSDNSMREVNSHTKSDYNLLTLRTDFTQTMGKGSLDYGAEYNTTNRDQNYNIIGANINSVSQASEIENKQSLWGTYISYKIPLGNFTLKSGLRYENVDFNYFENDQKIAEQSKKYNDWLPSAGITFNNKKVHLQLSYDTRLSRPSYSELSSSLFYVSTHVWEQGNPFLQSALNKSLSLMLYWKDLQVSTSATNHSRSIGWVYEQYKNDWVVLSHPINLPNYNDLSLTISYSHKFGIWRPSIMLYGLVQALEYGTPKKKYNKPIGLINFSNTLKLPSDFLLTANFSYTSKGNVQTNYVLGRTSLGLSLNKKFFDKKLSVTLKGSDIIGSFRQKYSTNTNNVYYFQDWEGGSQTIKLSIKYNFNSTKSKYKGNSNSSEINRL